MYTRRKPHGNKGQPDLTQAQLLFPGPIPDPVVTPELLYDPRPEPNLNQPGKTFVHIPKPSKVVKNLTIPAGNEITDLDVPIAIRKGVWSCTTHPIAKYLSYHRLSDNYKAFTSKISHLFIPRTIHEALEHPDWKPAVMEEINALNKNKTWEIVDLPVGKKTVGCKWVFTVKCRADGSIDRHKARLVAKGFTQTYGLDYQETFAPVAKVNSIRILLSMAAIFNWPLHQLDVKNAFLNGNLEEEVFMDPPPGFESEFGYKKVCRLVKSLYGLKQSPRA